MVVVSRVVINVGGEIYETRTKTLNRFSNTLLGDETKRKLHYCTLSNQYFFNRSRVFFDAILFFYQSNGLLVCPEGIALDLFIEECHFFELPKDVIDKLRPREQQSINEEEERETQDDTHRRKTIRTRIWDITQNPETSLVAHLFSVFSLFMIALSVFSTCGESVPSRHSHAEFAEDPWAISELVLNSWFLLELVLSLFSSPDIREFLLSTMTWIDIIAVVPYFALLTVSKDKLQSLGFLRIIRLARITRMFRLSKHSKRLKLVGRILLSCMGDFKVVLMCCLIVVMLSGALVTYLEDEGRNGSGFTSIPQGMYWAAVTLTTVGYSDIYPLSTGGRIFAMGLMLFGTVTVTIPLLSIVSKFEENYKTNW